MKREKDRIWLKKGLAGGIVAGLFVSGIMLGGGQTQAAEPVQGRVLVQYKDSQMASRMTKKLGNSAFSEDGDSPEVIVEDNMSIGDMVVGAVTSEQYTTQELQAYMEKQPGVVAVEPDRERQLLADTNDTYTPFQWSVNNTSLYGGTVGMDNSARTIWNAGITGNSNNVVAVVDSGVDYTHEDLKDNMWVNKTSNLPGTYGYDFGDNDTDPMDIEGHGTHVAGIIGALGNNGIGVTGVNQKVKIMALKVESSAGKIYESSEIAAFEYIYKAMCAGVKVKAVNISLGSASDSMNNTSSIYTNVVKQVGKKGAITVFASGNDGKKVTRSYFTSETNNDYCITVGASNENDNMATYSNYGSSAVDLLAPGSNILSTVCSDTFLPFLYDTNKRNALCSFYSSMDSAADVSNFRLYSTSSTMSGEVSWQSDINYCNLNPSSGSLKMQMRNASSMTGSMALLYRLPESEQLSTSTGNYRFSFMDVGDTADSPVFNGNASIGYNWESSAMIANKIYTIDGVKYLSLLNVKVDPASSETFYLDEIGISTKDPLVTNFGRYDFMTGTSMAAPQVTGAVALLAAVHPEYTVGQLRRYLLENVRKYSELNSSVVTGGILDLSAYEAIGTQMSELFAAEKAATAKTSSLRVVKRKVTVRRGKSVKVKYVAKKSASAGKIATVRIVSKNTKLVKVKKISGSKVKITVLKRAKKGKSTTIVVKSGTKRATIKVKVK